MIEHEWVSILDRGFVARYDGEFLRLYKAETMVASSMSVDLSETGAVVWAAPTESGEYWQIQIYRWLQSGETETLLMFAEPIGAKLVVIPASRPVSP